MAPNLDNQVLSADCLIVDSGGIIKGSPLQKISNEFFTTDEVLKEVKDPNSRNHLNLLPFDMKVADPSESAIKAVSIFARKTGDYYQLSATDLRILALTYQIDVERMGGNSHLRKEPLKPVARKSIKRQGPKSGKVYSFSEGAGVNWAEADQIDPLTDDWADFDIAVEMTPGREEAPPAPYDKLLDLSAADAATAVPEIEEDPEYTAQKSGSGKDKVSLPGFVDTDDEEEGWLTPDNLKSMTGRGHKKKNVVTNVKVACVTTDFAMQNVLVQMGLKVVSVDGVAIHNVRHWAFKCHTCNGVTRDMSKKFCPDCGAPTLIRTSVVTDSNGQPRYGVFRKPFSTRGTKFSIPKAIGGQRARETNMVLREDQYGVAPEKKKKARADTDDDWTDWTTLTTRKAKACNNRAGLEGRTIGHGRRNPNAKRQGRRK